MTTETLADRLPDALARIGRFLGSDLALRVSKDFIADVMAIHAEASVRRKCGDELDQLRTQLAGCLTAADGATTDPAKQGDYGWSPAYQRVLELRQQLNRTQQALAEAMCVMHFCCMEQQPDPDDPYRYDKYLQRWSAALGRKVESTWPKPGMKP